MGNAVSPSTNKVSTDLGILCSSASSMVDKEAAFQRLRNHFSPQKVQSQHLLESCARIERQRFPLWPQHPSKSKLPMNVLADRIRGLVFGCALGDSCGLATEFLSSQQIKDYYGRSFNFCPKPKKMFPDTHRIMWSPGDWTDDTDQMVLILQSLLSCVGMTNGTFPAEVKAQLASDFARRIKQWQECGFEELGDEGGAGLGQHTKAVMARPGFLQDPTGQALEVWDQGGKRSASNGAIMRTAITGVPFFWDVAATLELTDIYCRATHPDPRCLASCSFVAACVALLVQGQDVMMEKNDENNASIETIIDRCLENSASKLVRDCEELDSMVPDTFVKELQQVVDHARSADIESLKLDEVSGIGYTYKCLSAGIWGLTSDLDFEEIISQLVAAGGDADTNAAVAGALVGCRIGFSRLPQHWMAQLPYASWLEAHVQKVLFMVGCRNL